MSDFVRVRHEGPLTRVTLARPERRNSLTIDMVAALRDATRAIADNVDHGAVLVDAEGPDFCVGVDLHEFAARAGEGDYARTGVTLAQEAVAALWATRVPVVVAVQGTVTGGGLGIALCADLILVAEDARFLTSYTRIGMSPDGGVSWQLVRRVGAARAADLLLNNRVLGAAEASEWGLVNGVYPTGELAAAAELTALELAAGPAAALIATKRLIRAASLADHAAHLDAEAASFVALNESAEQRDRIAAFARRHNNH